MDTTVITELSEYYEKELGYKQPPQTPFVGSNFNVTRAGIHADGLLKNEEIYNIFDTGKFLNRPPLVAVSNTMASRGVLPVRSPIPNKEQLTPLAPYSHALVELLTAF